MWRHSAGIMVSALARDSEVHVQALARDTVLCSWARDLTLTVPLHQSVKVLTCICNLSNDSRPEVWFLRH